MTLAIKIPAFITERLSACPLSEIFSLNVIAGVTIRVVVMDVLFDGMPR